LKHRFEFVVLNSPYLSREPEPEAFQQQFQENPDELVLEFLNVGSAHRPLKRRKKASELPE
jgi:hypothetical protein